MKRIVLCLIALLLFSGIAFADGQTFVLLTAKATTGAGSTITPSLGTVLTNWSCDAALTGAPSAVTVRLEGNQNGSTFGTTGMASHTCSATELTDTICQFSVADSPARNIRAYVVTLTSTGSVSVDMTCTGAE